MKKLVNLSILFFFTTGILSLIYMVTKTVDSSGAIDFHSYWYAGHFIRQQSDPYQAYLEDLAPQPPVSYLDNKIIDQLPIAQAGLARVPANTPLFVLLLSPFSYLSWFPAKLLWMILNLLFSFIIPFLMFKLSCKPGTYSWKLRLLLYLIFLTIFGTRNTVAGGQTSLFIFSWMLLSVITSKKNWILSGISLGLALSKFSFSLPVVLLFLVEGRFRIIALSLVIQFLGLWLLSGLVSQPMSVILQEYFQIMQGHLDQPGIHLSSLITDRMISPLWVSIVFSIFFFGIILIWWWKNHKTYPVVLDSCQRLGLFASFSIFTLLVAYHRAYDTCLAFIFIFLLFQWIENPAIIARTSHHRRNLVLFLGFVILILSLPARGFAYLGITSWPLIEKTWLFLQSSSVTFALLMMLGLCIYFLFKLQSPVNSTLQSS